MLLSQLFNTVATKNQNGAAFHFLGKDIPYGEIRTRVARLSYLYNHDLGANARVAFLATNHPVVATTFLALSNIRAVSILLDPAWSNEDLLTSLKEAKATHLAVTGDQLSRARELLQGARLNLPLIEIEKKQGGEYDTSYTPPSDNPPLETDVILYLRTSSGAGQADFVGFSHKQFQSFAVSHRTRYHLLANDRFLTTLSWSHPFAFTHGMLLPLLSGTTAVIDSGEEGPALLDFLLSAKVTRLIGLPPYFLLLLITCKNAKRGLPGIKSVTVSAGKLIPEVEKAFAGLKIPVLHCYGQTECLWTIALEDSEDPQKKGQSLPGFKYKVLDDKGDEIPGSGPRTGQLAVMSPAVMVSYPAKEKETKQALRGTWLHTGDIVTLDGDGEELRISFIGRSEDVIQENGRYTSLRTVDSALRKIPGVQDGASFILKNAEGVPALVCAVVKTPGVALNEQQTIGFCSEKLAPELLPKAVAFTDSIPYDAAGNVNRGRLRSQFAGLVC